MPDEENRQVPAASAGVVELAYAIAVDTYASAREQWESVHRRLETLLSFVTTVTIAAPVAAEAVLDDPDFGSPLIITAGAIYLLVVLIALVARSFGAIRQISPRELSQQWLRLEEDEFRRGIIGWAGEHSDEAQTLIDRKNLAANVMALLFVTEAVMVTLWVVTTG